MKVKKRTNKEYDDIADQILGIVERDFYCSEIDGYTHDFLDCLDDVKKTIKTIAKILKDEFKNG